MKIIVKILFIVLGSLSLLLGILGIFVPGLPTTPFLLLTAWFYIRSSKKLYDKLIRNKFLGKYIVKFNKDRGISKKTKIYSIIIMWVMISLSTIFFIESISFKILVISIGIIGTFVMGFVIKTVKKTNDIS